MCSSRLSGRVRHAAGAALGGVHLVGFVRVRVVVRVALQAEDDAVGEKPVGVPGVEDRGPFVSAASVLSELVTSRGASPARVRASASCVSLSLITQLSCGKSSGGG